MDMFNRRDFLLASLGLLTSACTPIGIPLNQLWTRKARYIVPTPHIYWRVAQDLSGINYDTYIPTPKGFDEKPRSLITVASDDGKKIQRINSPGFIHAVASNQKLDVLYFITVDKPSLLLAVDPHDFSVIEAIARPQEEDPYIFSGHAVEIPGTDLIAVPMTSPRKGMHDIITIRHGRTLKKVDQFSTYGFEAHDITLSKDGKYFGIAHYGSYMGSGPYRDIGLGGADYRHVKPSGFLYPASVSVVNAKNGKLERLLSERRGGQQGHAVFDENNELYLANDPPFIESIPDAEKHPRLQQGEQKKPIFTEEFAHKSLGLGTTVTYDEKYQEVIIPSRYRDEIVIANTQQKTLRRFSFRSFTQQKMPHGLVYHPDGKHYIVSTSDGFLAFTRKGHEFVPEHSFSLKLQKHSHCLLYA